jgi:predicted amidohydrolase
VIGSNGIARVSAFLFSYGAAAGAAIPPSEWLPWAPRAEIAPRTYVDYIKCRRPEGALVISGASNSAAFGGWEHKVPGVTAGQWYRFSAWYRTEGVPFESRQVVARLDWSDGDGARTGWPDLVWRVSGEGPWKHMTLDAPAPKGASAVKLQLHLLNAPQGAVWWDEITFEAVEAPAPRPVSVAAVNLRPSGSKSSAENLRRFAELVDRAVPSGTDVILLPEGMTVVSTGRTYVDVAEPVPGPATERLGELARSKKSWIVAGLYERDGQAVYNTAVLIDRGGRVTGKYRKVYLPREETEAGLTPGEGHPVFETDFGRIGMMICWDLQFPGPAQAMALQGAEVLLMPIWGGSEILGRARAIENRVFLVSSGYDYPAQIVDPSGEILATTASPGTVARTTIDLNRRYEERWLGEVRGRFMKEVRRP